MIDDINSEIKEMTDAKQAYDKLMREKGEALIQRIVTRMFEVGGEHLTSVMWTQWAPHFNDGSPCVFDVHPRGFYGPSQEKPKGRYYSHEEYGPDGLESLSIEQKDALNLLDGQLSAIDDKVFERVFGYDAEVEARLVNGKVEFEKGWKEHD